MNVKKKLSGDMPIVYQEDTNHHMPKVFMTEVAYDQALRGCVIVVSDTIIIDKTKKTFWLTKRCAKPMQGLWLVGGRRFAGELPAESAARCFCRETSLDIPASRFKFVAMTEYLWKDRQQKPENVGCHTLSHTFSVELTPAERTTAAEKLDKNEYDTEHGLKEFSREDLVKAEVHSVLVDLYDKIFPPFING
jgi:ADP-ribose pyrophosphatase YjhB (NUDIX family)